MHLRSASTQHAPSNDAIGPLREQKIWAVGPLVLRRRTRLAGEATKKDVTDSNCVAEGLARSSEVVWCTQTVHCDGRVPAYSQHEMRHGMLLC